MLHHIGTILSGIAVVIGVGNMLLVRAVLRRLQHGENHHRQPPLTTDAETELDLSRRLIALQQARFSPLSRPIPKVKK